MILKVDFSREVICIDEPIPFKEISDIPCLCKVRGDKFLVEFVTTHTKIEGTLKNWSINALNDRAPSGAGGEYTYYQYGLISIKYIDKTNYKVLSLNLFFNDHGWLPFIENEGYATPKQFWDDEPEWLL
ncbi:MULTISPECIES: hypothetical protein [Psychrobacter]|uniref:hypothetical protein n=1 Tax=Psychrobacter TaxID=497 RepID=UPI00146C0576|nr:MULTISPECIES: hypothetical protein [Psychrobacter]